MRLSQRLSYITLADFIVRSAYQMGKTPLLPIFAMSLGANDAFLGFIVSVSTLTGMVLQPLIGVLSDSWGRRIWLIAGTLCFTVLPFAYAFISTPEQLFAVRIVHGLATAIYGPVTLAYVAELAPKKRAERIAWFSMARTAGYIVGPAVAGWLLLVVSPEAVFTVIGLISSIAFWPILLLPESSFLRIQQKRRSPHKISVFQALYASSQTPSVWLAGGLEAIMYVALYALKAFLPVYGVSQGISVALVGSFFAIQEGIHFVCKPWCARLADRIGYLEAIALGMAVISVSLPWVTHAGTGALLILPSVLLGIGQALISPSTVALVSRQVNPKTLGTGMGFIGMLKNSGKVLGPVLAGLLIQSLDFTVTLYLISIALLLSALCLCYAASLPAKLVWKKR